jgi:malonyl-CoA/methylmalonyl-CoA synthetase
LQPTKVLRRKRWFPWGKDILTILPNDKSGIPLIDHAEKNRLKTAVAADKHTYTYEDLSLASHRVASYLLHKVQDLQEKRAAFLIPPGFHYLAVQWGVWRAGGVCVPLSFSHPQPELEYVIRDSGAEIVFAPPEFAERLRLVTDVSRRRFVLTSTALKAKPSVLPEIHRNRRAMILYTSGTTSKPKGVVTSHGNIEAQVRSLISAWGWTGKDHILNVLPLNHVHGIINVVASALYAGATCEFIPGFNADSVWERFIKGGITLFMAVPTIYTRLISTWEASPPSRQKSMSEACSRLRLMVSGSAALPVSVLKKWKSISGHVLLERYGMTETGMILSNALHGKRFPGYVGTPLPGVKVKLVGEEGEPVRPGTPGEILVKGPGVFREYWGRPEETRKAFQDGWFRTGDIAVSKKGVYRILGRKSVDIIKSGGYKVSALEVEEALRSYPAVVDCAVVGLADPEWGERVCAAVVLKSEKNTNLDALRAWLKGRLAKYKIPKSYLLLGNLPKNALGKVSKPELIKLFRRNLGKT